MDCPGIPDLQYSDFSARLRQKAASQRLPIHGSLELTFRCNLRCQHCYIALERDDIGGLPELSLAEIRRILDEVVDAGCLWFLLTGGEPLARPDFADIYRYARQKGLLLTLYTNGTMISRRMADFLAEWRPFLIEISLYGYTQETHERITGVPGSHARCRRGIDLLLERGLPLRLKTPLLTLNCHELNDMRLFAQSQGVGFRFDPLINLGLPGGRNQPQTLRLTPEEVIRYEMDDPKRRAAWEKYFAVTPGSRSNPDQMYTCSAGWNSFHINPYGQLSLCMMERYPSYDLRQGTFAEGWDHFLAPLRVRPVSSGHPCSACDLRSSCAQCPGWGQVEYGDRERRVDYLCQIAHLRSEIMSEIQDTQNQAPMEPAT